MKKTLTAWRRAGGFTLLELLTAITVLTLMLLLVVNMTGSVNDVVSHQKKQMDSIGSARAALDTLNADLNSLVTLGGTTLLFKPGDATVSDELRFLTNTRSANGVARPRMMLVKYRIETHHDHALEVDHPVFVRGVTALSWPANSAASVPDYDFATTLANATIDENSVASSAMFRLEIVWLRKDGEVSRDPRGTSPSGSADAPTSQGYYWINLKEVAGFVVSVVAMDGGSMRRVAEAEEIDQLRESFGSLKLTDEGILPADEWSKAMATVAPEYARKDLRILSRTYFFPNQ